MAHEFTSGIMMNSNPAWHGLGKVIDGTLPARQAFNEANALFNVEKAPLYCKTETGEYSQIASRVAVKRSDTGMILGTVSPNYEIIQNETLCQMAEMLRDDIIMDTVVVLKRGAKVCFTGRIVGTDTDVIPGDTIHRNLVGYLGHDGYTSFGGIFTNIRVVCANTLGFAQQDGKRSGKQFSIAHNKIQVAQIDEVLRNIDIARQTFKQAVTDYQRMAETKMEFEAYKQWLTHLYEMPPVKQEDATLRPGCITDSPIKWKKLCNAWVAGYGSNLDGVANTVWAAFNSVTEVETSLRESSKIATRLQSATWGPASRIVDKAYQSAMAVTA
jgi:phage/plasmid-like protein (TIGR03299 family)